MNRLSFIVAFLGIALGNACGDDESNTSSPVVRSQTVMLGIQAFGFSSGGRCHPEGFGEWTVSLDSVGEFPIGHDVCGVLTSFDPALSELDNAQLWELFEAARVHELASSTRLGVPDEVRYTFVTRNDAEERLVGIWASDALQDQGLARLVNRIGAMIETYTGETPVLE